MNRTIDELGAMAAARRQLEMLPVDQRAEVLRDDWMVCELLAASKEYLSALQAFANDGHPTNYARHESAEVRVKAAIARFGGAP